MSLKDELILQIKIFVVVSVWLRFSMSANINGLSVKSASLEGMQAQATVYLILLPLISAFKDLKIS